jgi:iron-sulfur cluster repair protein YtfE (RIC family)
MKRSNKLHSLSHDHHHGLKLAQLIKKDAPLYKNLPNSLEGKIEYTKRFFNEELIRHFKEEEEILFKISEGKDEEADKLIKEIVEEHEKIKSFIVLLDKAEEKINLLDDIGNLLAEHIRKEERKLFPRLEEILSMDELEKISLQLRS